MNLHCLLITHHYFAHTISGVKCKCISECRKVEVYFCLYHGLGIGGIDRNTDRIDLDETISIRWWEGESVS